MTKAKAINEFFSSFGLNAYPSNRVPDDVVFPYLTYQQSMSNNGMTVYPTVNIWFHTDSEIEINQKADEISKSIGLGKSIKCDDGAIYVFMEQGWTPLTDASDSSITGRTTNLSMTFNTF